ncbi:PilZ domain-containing protein [Ectothiorhodospiraceae bacterium BW-2]|nr:PilZ domain-containing protein [Ectothiorhodospiraceae bacterium BW-2]
MTIDKQTQNILSELQKHPKSTRNQDERRYQRNRWRTSCSAKLQMIDEASTKEQNVEIVTYDISQGGFSFISKENIKIGTIVTVIFDMLETKPVIRSEVRSSVFIRDTQYRIGVCFIDIVRKLPEDSYDFNSTISVR